ncbi:MAG: hypothetical protein J2P41_04740 [Blastocatellia bacterium]|nr:hypothetical protein [Blastocatellia bacterium]
MKRVLSTCGSFYLPALIIAIFCQAGIAAQTRHKQGAAKAAHGIEQRPVKLEAVSMQDVQAMLSDIWVIETSPSFKAAELPAEFLPPGTRVQLELEGPTRLAAEEGRKDELRGEFILLPPFLAGICASPFGEGDGPGSQVCDKGQVKNPNGPVRNEAEFSFERWEDQPTPDEIDKQFFVEQGAKRGSHFLTIYFRYKGVTWNLWIRDPDTMIGYYYATLPSNESEQIVQIWRRTTRFTGRLSAQTIAQEKTLTAGHKYPYTMLNGTWRIVTRAPAKEVSYMAEEYLPPDTRLKLEINAAKIENKLEGSVTLLPPYDQEICKTAFNQDDVQSPSACMGDKVIDPYDSVSFATEFAFKRWNPRLNKRGNKIFYLVEGIKQSDQIVYIDPIDKGATWKLWIRDHDTMIGECFVMYTTKEPDILIQIWRRVKTP